MAISGSGRLWATWYAGSTPAEDHNNYAVLATSGDGGGTWQEVLVVDPDGSGPVRAFDPQVWTDPLGRLWFFWTQSIAHEGALAGAWAMINDTPDIPGNTWTPPRRLANGVMMCKPLVFSSGEWVLPVSAWRTADNSARLVVSTDKGRTWSVRGGCDVPFEDRCFDEHMIIERADGSLWMLVRTCYGIGESVSTDRGRTWSPLARSPIQHPSARFFITRLASRNLLLVKHGPIKERTERSHLTAFLSQDEGATWSGGLILDERTDVSYPDGQQDAGGAIRIIYDYSRTGAMEILMALFREEDVLAAGRNSAHVRLRMTVSKPGSDG